jgi:hypothetical protein
MYGPPEPAWTINNRRRVLGRLGDPYYAPVTHDFGPYTRGRLVPVRLITLCNRLKRIPGNFQCRPSFCLFIFTCEAEVFMNFEVDVADNVHAT